MNEHSYHEQMKIKSEVTTKSEEIGTQPEEIVMEAEEVMAAFLEDGESMEEFDPDDPIFEPEWDAQETDDEISKPTELKPNRKKIITPKRSASISLKSWSKEPRDQTQENKVEQEDEMKPEKVNDYIQPEFIDMEQCKGTEMEDSSVEKLKVPNLTAGNVLSTTEKEDGIMYVTVKGSKPNELLLVKVNILIFYISGNR